MNFLILGCNGMAGHTILLYLQSRGHFVYGVDKNISPFVKSEALDVTDLEKLKQVVFKYEFDSIVNCIGVLNESAERNKATAVFLNSFLPHYLAELTKTSDIQVIHMSTDCVFSGKKGCYVKNDFKDGESFYDRTKALGELEDSKNFTIRTSIVGPDINPNGIGLLNWFLRQKGPINGYTKTMWTGQTTLQLAKTIEQVALRRAHGLYNLVPDRSISKYELCKLFNKYLRGGKIEINPVEGVKADKSLKRTRFEFDYLIPDYEEMIKEMAEWIKGHNELYPHYNLQSGGSI